MKFMIQTFVVVVSLCLAGCDDITCTVNIAAKCQCYNLTDGSIFVDCHGANLTLEEACKICTNILNVTRLDLSLNNLALIPESCFVDCHQVEKLSLASNNISTLQKNTFVKMSSLDSLQLDNNSLIRDNNFTSPAALESLTNLRSLNLKGNVRVNQTITHTYLSNIGNNRSFPGLNHLYLDGIPFGSFGENFINFKNLKSIDLSGIDGFCTILGLTNYTFLNVQQVTHLNLSKCRISTIEADTFGILSKLVNLNLSHNMELGFYTLRNVSYGLQSTQIKVLDYSKVYKTFGTTNQLKRCDIWFLKDTKLKELRLNSNRMSSIEVDGLHLVPTSLEVFWAEDNNWNYGPYILQTGCISNLSRVEISGKEIIHDLGKYNDELHVKEKENIVYDPKGCMVPRNSSRPRCPFLMDKKIIPETLTSPQALKMINMRSANLFFKLPSYNEILVTNNYIESVDFSSNILYSWGGKFVELKKLKHISLSNNFCSNVTSEFFMNTPNLISLDISINKLGTVLGKDVNGLIFKPLHKLQKLNLSNNAIESLPEQIFAYLGNLESLNLSYNRIPKVNFAFTHMPLLSELDLQQNKISSLPIPLLEQMDSYCIQKSTNISIDLSKNEIDLSCENLKFVDWMSEHTRYFTNIATYQFRRKDNTIVPYSEFFKTLSDLHKNCQSFTPVIIVSVISLTAFIIVVLGGLVFRFRWRLRYLYYMTKAKYTGYIPLRDPDFQETFQYDAFISYANEDLEFVRDEMVRLLEDDGELAMCVHERDFTPGRYIADNILSAIKCSRSTIILLSKNFLQSKWCMYEFNMARMEGIYSRSGENIVLVIMYEEVNMANLSPEMVKCLDSESFLKYPSEESEIPYFWQTLKQALVKRRN